MSALVGQFLAASPTQILLALLFLLVLWLLLVLAPVARLEAKAWFLHRRGVPAEKVAAWALSEAKKERPSPIVEVIEAVKGKPDGPS